MGGRRLFTSEAVTEGHPDKVCDQIADRILDELLKEDPMSRCACEVTAEPGAVHIMGEITTAAHVDYEACARQVIREIGYTDPELGFTDQCAITCSIHQQSQDIARGVNCSLESREDGAQEIGAGDQGMMFGFACTETPEYMPLPIHLANRLTRRLTELRKTNQLPYLRPDGKAQVTVEYRGDVPKNVTAVVLSAQHDPQIEQAQLCRDLWAQVIQPVIPAELRSADMKVYINPTGRFVLGGPAADTGLTGRKIIADTYGGYARHGGGAFSGKDPTKVDRSAAYMARYIAKHLVAAQLASKCELQLGYSIGVAQPVSVSVNTFGTGKLPDEMLEKWVCMQFDLRPAAMIETLQLRRPIYFSTAAYGHFGVKERPWEVLDDRILHSANVFLSQCRTQASREWANLAVSRR